MLNLGIIGTNWISQQFVQAAVNIGKYRLHSVYSRKLSTASEFAKEFGDAEIYDDMAKFLDDDQLEIIYIASPNGLHFTQAKACICKGTIVIVEKPAFSTVEEMDEILSLANEKKVFYFEAMRSIHEPSFMQIFDYIQTKEVWGADFNFAKYSSRMDELLDGGTPNIFSTEFSGGALMDLGVYLVYPAVTLFGMPQSVKYTAKMLPTGVDAYGTGVLRYENFDVSIRPGKTIDRYTPSEIYFEEGTLSIDEISSPSQLTYFERGAAPIELLVEKQTNPMADEAAVFSKIVRKNDVTAYEELADLSRKVNQVMKDMRDHAGIVFAADKKEDEE
ncbi:MAG: Gfo/Idh/MocA family oxidoreductase [Streptococcaceae bacterium]|jgi:predicted dehydrogenase|nr:Gfo/Idh/MocA family oxidoreductase [Streptococcaceae bacterium]